MRMLENIVTRGIIWLAASAVALQGLAVASCNCSATAATRQQAHSSLSCCAVKKSDAGRGCCVNSHTCCGSEEKAGCNCGVNCRCNTTPRPSSPPPANNSESEKLAADSVHGTEDKSVCVPQLPRLLGDAMCHVAVRTALESCVSLCRFTL